MPDQSNDLVLLHGRTDPAANLEDWGFDGPVIQGVAWVHWTYGTLTVGFTSNGAAERAAHATGWHWFDENILEMSQEDDLIAIRPNSGQGKTEYFGDFELQAPGYRKTRGE